ncbi:MAG: hypothetical protein AAF328_10510 [Planctomycetota bacterium]
MNGHSRSIRGMYSLGVAAVIGGVAADVWAVNRNWDGSSSQVWQDPLNWTGNAVPGFGDTATIGLAPPGLNVVSLNLFDAEADAVTLLGNTFSFLATDGGTLTVDDDTPAQSGLLDIGSGATVRADVPGAGQDFLAIDADDVRIRGGLTGPGRLIAAHRTDVDDLLTIDEGGELWGAPADAINMFQSFLRVGHEKVSGVGLINNGTIRATSPGLGNTEVAGRLSIQLRDDVTIDLDGPSGDGKVFANDPAVSPSDGARLSIFNPDIDDPDATLLSDAFSGEMVIGPGGEVRIEGTWQLDGSLAFSGQPGDNLARLNSDRINVSSTLLNTPAVGVTGRANIDAVWNQTDGVLRIGPDATVTFDERADFGAAADIVMTQSPRINFFGGGSVAMAETDFDGTDDGGSVSVGSNEFLDLQGDIELAGGTFDGRMSLLRRATLRLGGSNAWSSSAELAYGSGAGQLLIIGGSTTFNNNLDLDGPEDDHAINGPADVTVEPSARLNVRGLLDADADQAFDGAFSVQEAGVLDIEDPRDGRWELDGVLGLGTFAGPFDATTPARLVGDPVDVDGDFVGTGVSEVDANIRFRGQLGAGTAFSASRLDFEGDAQVRFEAGSFFDVDLFGRSPANDQSVGRHDLVTAHDATIDGGTIELQLVSAFEEYAPPLYFEHTVLLTDAADGLDGTMGGVFDQVDGVLLSGFIAGTDVSDTSLAVTYTDAAVIVQRALSGDANLSGQVEQGDLNAVLTNWGQNNLLDSSANVSWVTGDLNGDGRVAQADLNAVLNN